MSHAPAENGLRRRGFVLVIATALCLLSSAGAAMAWRSTVATVNAPTSLSVNASTIYTATALGNNNDTVSSVVFTFPANTDISAATMQLSQGALVWTPTLTRAGTTLTGTLSQPLTRATLAATVANVRSPSQPGGYTYSVVFTSQRGTASGTSAVYNLVANTTSPAVGVVTLSTYTTGLPAAYTIPFTVGPQGRLAADAAAGPNRIYLDFPVEYSLPAAPSPSSVTVNGASLATSPTVTGQRVTIQVPPGVSVPGGGAATVLFSEQFGLVNPGQGAYAIGVSTSAETGIGSSPSYTVTPPPDTTPPFTTVLASPAAPDGMNGWYVSLPLLSLVPDEVASTYYWWNLDARTPYLAPFYAPEGDNVLSYYSVDSYANTEATKTAQFKVDVTPPGRPALAAGAVTSNTAEFSWAPVADDGSGVAHYEIYRDGTLLSTTTATSYSATGLAPSTTYEFTVKAKDNAGLYSALSDPLSMTTQGSDTVPPVTTLTSEPATSNGLSGWFTTPPVITLSSSESGLTFYAWDTNPPEAYGSLLTADEGVHSLHYYSVDIYANAEETKTAEFKVDTVPPGAPALTASLAGGSSIQLDWSAVSDTTSGVLEYRVIDVDSGDVVATTPELTTTITGLPGSITKTYTVRAVDRAGNEGAPSNSASQTTPAEGPYTVTDPATGVTLNFFSASDHGVLTVTKTPPAHASPSNFDLLGDLHFDISATTVYSGDFLVNIPYNPAMLADGNEENLRMFHHEGGEWIDITVAVDPDANIVIGRASSFSPFGVYAPSATGEPVQTPASSTWSLLGFALLGLGAIGLRLRRA